jgi:hypothetical protein
MTADDLRPVFWQSPDGTFTVHDRTQFRELRSKKNPTGLDPEKRYCRYEEGQPPRLYPSLESAVKGTQ